MNTQKRLLILLLSIGVMLLNSTCKQKLFQKITYDGHVYDKSGNLASGIKVVLQACGGGSGDKQANGCSGYQFEIGSDVTDASGHFHISGNAASTGWYYVILNGIGVNMEGVTANTLTTDYYYLNLHMR
jgi:hypothetical protein